MQLSLNLPDRLLLTARKYAEKNGYSNLQEFIRELIREKLFEREEKLTGLSTYLASESVLAKDWLSKEEDEAWAHLQEKT